MSARWLWLVGLVLLGCPEPEPLPPPPPPPAQPPGWYSAGEREVGDLLEVMVDASGETEDAAKQAAWSAAYGRAAQVRATRVRTEYERVVESSSHTSDGYADTLRRVETSSTTQVEATQTIPVATRERDTVLPDRRAYRAFVRLTVPMDWVDPTRRLRAVEELRRRGDVGWIAEARALALDYEVQGETALSAQTLRQLWQSERDLDDAVALANLLERDTRLVEAIQVLEDADARFDDPTIDERLRSFRARMRDWPALVGELEELVRGATSGAFDLRVDGGATLRRGEGLRLQATSEGAVQVQLVWVDSDGLAPWPWAGAEQTHQGSWTILSERGLNTTGTVRVVGLAWTGSQAPPTLEAPISKAAIERRRAEAIGAFERYLDGLRAWAQTDGARAALVRFEVR